MNKISGLSIFSLKDKLRQLQIRIFSYFVISIGYYYYMNSHSPLGIAWRPFHHSRVFNAINNLVNPNPLRLVGLTSWDPWTHIASSLERAEPFSAYLVPGLPHFLHVLSSNWFGYEKISQFGSIFDYFLISLVACISAEYIRLLNCRSSMFAMSSFLLEWFWPVSAFLLFLSSPLTYRMMLAPWHEVPWLAFLLLFYILVLNNKPIAGLICMIVAGLYHWMLSFLLAVFYSASLIFSKYSDRSAGISLLYPPNKLFGGNDLKNFLLLALISPAIAVQLSLYVAKHLLSISHNGSSPLARIGIDSVSNIHHGGILAALQFLGGNRLSQCLIERGVAGLDLNISRFNCLMAITSFGVISGISLFGYFFACHREKSMRWSLVPLCWTFAAFLLIFQQSNAVHLQGHSFVFVFIYTYGAVYLLNLIAKKLRLSESATFLVSAPLILAILINSIRVSFFTGYFG